MPLQLSAVVPTALFHDGPFRWRTVARRVGTDAWLQFDHDTLPTELAEKARILEQDRHDAVVMSPGAAAACAEVAQLVDEARVGNGLPGLVEDGRHPLERAARAVHEDLVVMQRSNAGWVMTAGVVCFPTRWSPADKIGRSMAAIHQPVPRYDTIAAAVDRLFDRLQPGVVVWRPNWSIVGDGALRLPVQHRQAPVSMPSDPMTDLWLRVERQTLRRLVDHDDALVFTIRVHRWPLRVALDDVDTAMVAELRGLPDDVAVYKNLDSWRHELAAHLDGLIEG
ncbi:MAG: DUF3445 domain-containing protein [Actinomycetota bacterium]